MIDDTPICLLGQVLIETSVPCLHMKDRYLKTLSRNGGQCRIGVSQYEQSIGTFFTHDLIRTGYDISDGNPSCISCDIQINIGASQTQILIKDIIQSGIVILSRMNKDMLKEAIRLLDGFRQSDKFRARPHNSHQLQWFDILHYNITSEYCLYNSLCSRIHATISCTICVYDGTR